MSSITKINLFLPLPILEFDFTCYHKSFFSLLQKIKIIQTKKNRYTVTVNKEQTNIKRLIYWQKKIFEIIAFRINAWLKKCKSRRRLCVVVVKLILMSFETLKTKYSLKIRQKKRKLWKKKTLATKGWKQS